MKLLLAPDKFKGSLSAAAVSDAIETGWKAVFPETVFLRAPMADGGEGFCEALHQALDGEWMSVQCVDALGRSIQGRYVWVSETRTAIVEMSEASGLWRLKADELDPYRANTFGTGLMLKDAVNRGAKRILVGLGGSATTDGGIGMAAALGYRFLGANGEVLEPVPQNFERIVKIDRTQVGVFPEIVAACDVQNPLLGARGTATVFAPQKGADAKAVEFLECGLRHLSDRVAEATGQDYREVAGVGAAGGIGFGLLSFCAAKMEPGFDLVSEAVGLEERIREVDIVVTGEGRLDGQTLEGKGPAGVAALARSYGKRVIAFAGSIAEDPAVLERFDAVVPVVDRPMSLPEAMQQAPALLERAANRTARLLTLSLSL
ncbi:MAG: glycerate kinase [Verrucomicrobiota bacterium]